MKKFLIVILAACAFAAIAFSATYTKTYRITRAQFDIAYDATNTVTAVKVGVFAEPRITNDADATDVAPKPWQAVNFDLLDSTLSAVSVTAAGKTVTYPQLAALLRQAAVDRYTASGLQP